MLDTKYRGVEEVFQNFVTLTLMTLKWGQIQFQGVKKAIFQLQGHAEVIQLNIID